METIEIIGSICLGVGLAAAVGFRVFLPLLILSVAGYFGYLPLTEDWSWVGSITAIIALAAATIIEIFGYYIPWVDNALDTIAIPLATVAGTAVMMATMADVSPLLTWSLAIIAGGGTAAAIKGSTSAVRLTSSATTGGIANPIVSTVETGTATAFSFIAILIPILIIVLVPLLFYILFKTYKKLRKKKANVS